MDVNYRFHSYGFSFESTANLTSHNESFYLFIILIVSDKILIISEAKKCTTNLYIIIEKGYKLFLNVLFLLKQGQLLVGGQELYCLP